MKIDSASTLVSKKGNPAVTRGVREHLRAQATWAPLHRFTAGKQAHGSCVWKYISRAADPLQTAGACLLDTAPTKLMDAY